MHLYIWTIAIALFIFLYVFLKSTFDISWDAIGLFSVGGIKLSTKSKQQMLELDRLFFSPYFWMNSGFRLFSLQLQGLKLKLKTNPKPPNKTTDIPSITHTIPYLLSLLLNLFLLIFELRIEGLELEIIEKEQLQSWIRIETVKTGLVSGPLLLEAIENAFDGAETKCFGVSVFLDRIVVEDAQSRQIMESSENFIALAFTRNRIKNSKVVLVGVFGEWELKNPHPTEPKNERRELMDAYEIQRLSKMIIKKTRSFFHKSPRVYLCFSKLNFGMIPNTGNIVATACAQKVEFTLMCGSASMNQIEVDMQVRVQGIVLNLGTSTQVGTIREIAFHSEIQCEVVKDDKCQILIHSNVLVNDPWMAVTVDQILSLLEIANSTNSTNSTESRAPTKVKAPSKIFLADLKKLIDFQLGFQLTNANLGCMVEGIELENDFFHFGTLASVEQASLSISTISVDSVDLSVPRIDLHAAFDMHSLKISTFERSTNGYLFECVPELDTLLSIPTLRFSNTVDMFRNSVESSLSLAHINYDFSILTESRVPMYVSLIRHLESLQDRLPRKETSELEENPLNFILNLHLTIGECMVLLSSDDSFSLTAGFSQLNGQFLLDESLCSQVALEQIFIEVGSVTESHCKVLKIDSPQLIQKAIGAVLQINSKEVHFDLNLSKFFVAFQSVLGTLKLVRGLQKPGKVKDSSKKAPLQLIAKIPKIRVDFELPEAVQTRFIFSTFRIKSGTEKNFVGDIRKIDIEVIRSPQTFFSELGVISDAEFELNPGNEPIDIVVNAGFSKLFVAYGWPMSNIVENFVNLNRAVKQVVFDALGLPPPTSKFASGKTMVETITFPNLIFKSAVLEVCFEDDPFESKLARNYLIGTDENGSRLIRERIHAQSQVQIYRFEQGRIQSLEE
jgi:hypothetical protein